MRRLRDYVCVNCGHYNVNPANNTCTRCGTDPSASANSGHFYDVRIGENQLTAISEGSHKHGKAKSNKGKQKAK